MLTGRCLLHLWVRRGAAHTICAFRVIPFQKHLYWTGTDSNDPSSGSGLEASKEHSALICFFFLFFFFK